MNSQYINLRSRVHISRLDVTGLVVAANDNRNQVSVKFFDEKTRRYESHWASADDITIIEDSGIIQRRWRPRPIVREEDDE